MKKFIYKVLVYLLPVLLFFALPYIILEVSGELKDLSNVRVGQGRLLGLAYSDQSKDYKLNEILARKPEVLALGTSRVLQIRSFFFKKPDTFFNGGRVISRVGDLPCLIEEWDKSNYRPRVIILGLDQYFFNRNWDNLKEGCEYNVKMSGLNMLSKSSLDVYSDLMDGKIQVKNIAQYEGRHGLTAMMTNSGYRTDDGSYYYGKIIRDFRKGTKISFEDMEKRIERGKSRFEWGDEVNEDAIRILKSFVDYCADHKIELTMFLPPYPASIYNRMVDSGKYGYILKLDSAFSANSLRVHNFSSLDSLDSKDDEAIDGLHGSEVAYLRLIQELGKREPWLDKYIDQEQFKLLNAPANALELREEKY
jgi:hypothetical protein